MRKPLIFLIISLLSVNAFGATAVSLVDNQGHGTGIRFLYWYGTADADGFHAAITGNSSAITTAVTGFTDPDYPAKVTITTGGTTADVAAGNIALTGTDYAGTAQTENVSVTENQNGVSESTKIFATLTSVVIPIQDGNGATFTIGTSSDIVATYSSTAKTEIIGFRLHGSGAFGTENITFTLDSNMGSGWDAVLSPVALASATDIDNMFTIPKYINRDDELVIYCANANARTWGLEVMWRYCE